MQTQEFIKRKLPSRHFNDESVLLGLGFSDLIGLSIVLLGLLVINMQLELKISPLSLMLGTISLAACLVPIRMEFRRHILRDYGSYVAHLIIKKINPKKALLCNLNHNPQVRSKEEALCSNP